MVSPSKIFKTSNSGLNFGFVSSKKDGLRGNGASKLRAPSTSQLTHSRLLSNTRFYLDIRNRFQLDKVEAVLKSYGAKIEIFFRKGIKVIVTDKAEWMGSSQSPSSSVSSLSPSPSTNQDQRFAVPKSRTSAMLEKVSQQPASSYTNPLELAQKWRIPILSVRSLWKWIAKVEESYITELNEKKEKLLESKIVVCARDKAPFIKIESIASRNIPEFLELEAWPSLHLDGRLGQCPFRFPSPPSPTLSEEQPQEVGNKLFEVKDKVSVELIQYDTDFRIKDQLKLEECEEGEGEQIEVSENQGQNNSSLERVQCNGLTASHRNSKLLSPSGSDVLPLPTSRRSTRRASASWCGSTRELSQLSPTDSEIENIRRSDSSFESHDPALDSPGITLRPKGQLWLPIALIGTTAEENGNCIRRHYEYSVRQSENAKLSSDLLDAFDERPADESDPCNEVMPRVSRESGDSSLNSISNCSPNGCQGKKCAEKRDAYCIVTRNARVKNEETNGRSRESSLDSRESDPNRANREPIECKKRSLSVCGRRSPSAKRNRTMSANSVQSMMGRKKKLSPEEKLLQDNKEYFKMEVLNTKLRSTGSLLGAHQAREVDANGIGEKSVEKIDKIIIKKINFRRRRKRRGRRTKVRSDEKPADFSAVAVNDKSKKAGAKINGVIRKKRQSELMKLCNEAESFMFGESSRQGSSVGGAGTNNATESESEDSARKKSSPSSLQKTSNVFEETSTDSNCEVAGGKARKKKRRSHAEAFIHDNLDYYKFETPGSRLRYQGSFAEAVKSEDKDFIYTMKHRRKEASRKGEVSEPSDANLEVHRREEREKESSESQERRRNSIRPSEEIEKILFSFESIPATEPWYEVYKRQDEGLENYYPLLSDPNDQPFLLPYELPKPVHSKMPAINEYLTRRRKKLVHLFNHPRKSPRCHASTLAILSSLKKRKRRSGTNSSVNSSLTSESPVTNSPSEDKSKEGGKPPSEREKIERENEEILDFLHAGEEESDAEEEEILLEPLSDSEGEKQTNWKNDDFGGSVKSDEEEPKGVKTGGGGGGGGNRGKKAIKSDGSNCGDPVGGSEEWQQQQQQQQQSGHFLWQAMNSDDFFKGMAIERGKKPGPVVSIMTILEGYRNCKSMEEPDSDSPCKSKSGGQSRGSSPEKQVGRRKKKARKINKTGWDNNRKSRRRTPNKTEVKEEEEGEEEEDAGTECSEVKENLLKGKVRVKGEESGNPSKKRSRKEEAEKRNDHRPVLRSHLEASDVAADGQDGCERRSDASDAGTQEENPSYVLRMKKEKLADSGTRSNLRVRCSNARYALQKTRLALNRKRKRVIDYAWSSRKR